MQHASTQSSTSAPAANSAAGAYALRDFPHTRGATRTMYFEGEDFPTSGLDAGELTSLQGAGFIGYGTAPAGSIRHGKDRRAVYEAKQRAKAQAAEILSESELEAATAPTSPPAPKKKR